MFDRLDVFRLAGALASHAGQRQTVVAANIAQADTAGYRALRVQSFAEAHAPDEFAMRATRPGHLSGRSEPGAARILTADAATSPDGNSVSIETEMAEAADASSDHSRALAIYRNGMAVLRASIGGR